MWWQPIVSFLLGALGWLAVKMLAEPLLAIQALRMEVQETLILFGNLRPDAPQAERSAAAERFLKVGAGLAANHLAAWPWVKQFYEGIFRWDPYSAAGVCMGYGRSIEQAGFSHPNLSSSVHELRARLNLPEPTETNLFRETMGEMRRPPSLDEG